MQIHIIDLHYLVDQEEVAKIRPSHRDFLDIGYTKGIFVASGPKTSKTGGIIIARGDLQEIKGFIKEDPFYINKIAEYHFTSFDAVKHIPELAKL
ncbi:MULTISPECIES: YciI family protein [Francisella]|uniref:YCII-related domain-containing protein n=1 Tax=Francisella opportunistica TaxID=2016517 RepID=A0A345JQ92_9GAMM|nr:MULTISPECIES: YciI family protein [Francisella]APC91186.1 hypothetical protein BBG19_0450 [Francisella sp. MA067296]AXH29488.1 hypothetical protein CGC43_02280 [Francisella opportunistica]AXH31139.1 hypothetical protein CGC44_02255 [Francisella opportunistica]AXH32784.1 hypothetical protein CGC45_02255 [Francisella opportunistica]